MCREEGVQRAADRRGRGRCGRAWGPLLDDGVEDVEKAVQTGNLPGLNLAASPLDENTKLALKVAVALFALVGVSIGERERKGVAT